MKTRLLILTLCALSATTFFAKAQTIPNADFENWTNGIPDGWIPIFGATTVSQSTDKQSGTYSLKLIIDSSIGGSFLFFNNSTNTFSNYLNGYIKTNISVTDTLEVAVLYLRSSDQAEAGGADMTWLNHSTWTPFHVTLNKSSGFLPDSFAIAFLFSSPSASNYVLIDNLSLSNSPIGTELGLPVAIGIKNLSGKQNINSSFYPNPTNGNGEIDFSLTSSSNITIKMYDVTGRFVKTILNETRTSGVQKIEINTEEVQNGIYFYTITGNGFSETKKFVISR